LLHHQAILPGPRRSARAHRQYRERCHLHGLLGQAPVSATCNRHGRVVSLAATCAPPVQMIVALSDGVFSYDKTIQMVVDGTYDAGVVNEQIWLSRVAECFIPHPRCITTTG